MALTINGQSVPDGVVETEFAEIKAYHERLGNISCCERDPEFRASARSNIVARALLSQEARRRISPLPEAEVDAAIVKLQEAHGGEQAFYHAIGGSPEQMQAVRTDVETDLRVAKMIEGLCDAAGEPTDAAARAFYAAHLQWFMTDEQVRASHILKSPPRGEDRGPAFETLRELRQRLLGGADFDEAAREHSDKASESIDLGFFKRGELPEEFEIVAFSMNPGEVSPVFGSPYGFHILKVTERKAAEPRPFDEARPDVLQRMRTETRNDVTRTLVESLKGSATIEDDSPVEEIPAPLHGDPAPQIA